MITRRLFLGLSTTALVTKIINAKETVSLGKTEEVIKGKSLTIYTCRRIGKYRGYVIRKEVTAIINQLVDEAGVAIYTLPTEDAKAIVREWTVIVAKDVSRQLDRSGLIIIDELPENYNLEDECNRNNSSKNFFSKEKREARTEL